MELMSQIKEQGRYIVDLKKQFFMNVNLNKH